MQLLQSFISPITDCFPAQVAITALLLLILLDWIFGIGNALLQKDFSSEMMREGIGHKCSELGFVVVGIILDAMITAGLDLGFEGPILTTISVYLCIMEVGSLMETFAEINPNLAHSPVFKILESVHIVDEEEACDA